MKGNGPRNTRELHPGYDVQPGTVVEDAGHLLPMPGALQKLGEERVAPCQQPFPAFFLFTITLFQENFFWLFLIAPLLHAILSVTDILYVYPSIYCMCTSALLLDWPKISFGFSIRSNGKNPNFLANPIYLKEEWLFFFSSFFPSFLKWDFWSAQYIF